MTVQEMINILQQVKNKTLPVRVLGHQSAACIYIRDFELTIIPNLEEIVNNYQKPTESVHDIDLNMPVGRIKSDLQTILRLFKTHEYITVEITERELSYSNKTVRKRLNLLVSEGYIRKRSDGSRIVYILEDQYANN